MADLIDPKGSDKLTDRNCDCVIVCDGHRFRLHRSVIEKHSPVLAASFNGCFKESHTMTYDATAFQTETIMDTILWMYGHGNAIDGLSGDANWHTDRYEKTLISLVRLNIAADYFGIDQLAAETGKSLEALLDGSWQTAAFINAAQVVATDSGDANVHRTFTTAAAKHIEELAASTIDITDLAALDGFAPVIIKAAALKMASMKAELEGIKGHVKWMKSEMETYKEATKKAMKELSDTEACCRCDSEFAGYVQTYDGFIFTAVSVVVEESVDAEVHQIIVTAAATHIGDLATTDADIDVLSGLDDIAPVLIKVAAKAPTDAKEKLNRLKSLNEWLKVEAHANKQASCKAILDLSKTPCCKKCAAEFSGYVQSNDGYIYVVRCKKFHGLY